jgi:hypothetical protein
VCVGWVRWAKASASCGRIMRTVQCDSFDSIVDMEHSGRPVGGTRKPCKQPQKQIGVSQSFLLTTQCVGCLDACTMQPPWDREAVAQTRAQTEAHRAEDHPARHQETLEAPTEASRCDTILHAYALGATMLLVSGAAPLRLPEGVATTGPGSIQPNPKNGSLVACGLPPACVGCGCWVWAQTCCPF